MPQLSDDGDLGASDELIQFHEEGERDDKRTGTAAETDLDDVKSSLVNETETTNGASGSEAANRRAGTEPDAPGRARHNRLSGEGGRPRHHGDEGRERNPAGSKKKKKVSVNRLKALRWQQTAGGLFAPSPYVGYPFFVIPDLRRSYLAGGGLAAARAYFPLQWPLLDIPGRSAMRDSATPVHLSSGVHADVGHLHPLLSRRPEGLFPPQRASPGFSPDPGSSRPPHVACYPISPGGGAHAFDWLQGQPVYPMTGGFSPATLGINASVSSLVSSGFSSGGPASSSSPSAYVSAAVKLEPREPREPREPGLLRKSAAPMVGTQAVDQKVKAHIKKPLNAFMLFMRDERPKVVAQCQVKESATINQILGQRWHSLSKDEQAKYYELARKERLLHSQLYPGWSARDNYGKKKKRKKSKSDPQQDTGTDDSPPQPKCAHLSSSVHDEAPHAHAPLMHARAHTSAVDMHTRTRPSRPRTVSHLTHTHLSQASPASSVDSPATPTAALASPAAPAPTHTEHTHSVTQSASYGEHTSPYGDRPLALTAKPPRDTHAPRLSAPTLEPPSPAPPSSSHRRANQLCVTEQQEAPIFGHPGAPGAWPESSLTARNLRKVIFKENMQEVAKRAVLVSVANFEPGVSLGARHGAKEDTRRLHRVLSKLDFQVDIHQDLNSHEIYRLFRKVPCDHLHQSNVTTCVLGADGAPVWLSRVFAYFDRADVERMAKVFLIQACRGDATVDSCGERESTDTVDSRRALTGTNVSVPVNAAVMYATVADFSCHVHGICSGTVSKVNWETHSTCLKIIAENTETLITM